MGPVRQHAWWGLGLLLLAGCAEETSTPPQPIVFVCDALDTGQSLSGTATVSGGDIAVVIASDNGTFTQAPSIAAVSSGTLGTVTVVRGEVNIPITGVGNSVSFSLNGRLTGPDGDFCDLARTFSVSVDGDSASVQ